MGTLFTGVDFAQVLSGVKECIPVILPTVVGFIAFRKGLSFVLGMVRGA